MKRKLPLIPATLAAAAVVSGFSFGHTPPAQAADLTAGKYQAKKILIPSWVSNVAGDDVKVKYGPDGDYRYLIERGDATRQSEYLQRSTTNFRSRHDARCIRWTGIGATDGLYKLHGNTWVSMPQAEAFIKVLVFGDCPSNARWIDQVR